jgi:serpin B
MRRAIAISFVAFLLTPERIVAAPADSNSIHAAAVASNQFGLDLYGQLRSAPGNLFFSPFSISTALAMTYAGADGVTEGEMANVLHLSADDPEAHVAYGMLLRGLGAADTSDSYQLRIANRLWGSRNHEFLPSFLAVTREQYGAELQGLDFAGDAEGSRETINSWVAEKTEQKIEQLLAPGMITPLTALVLTNAIYFDGAWSKPFKEDGTKTAPFHVSATAKVEAPLMQQLANLRYSKGTDFALVELPYKDSDLAMVVLLPDSIDGLPEIERRMPDLSALLATLQGEAVELYLPRFRMSAAFVLNDVLPRMGMPSAFDPSLADFSAIEGARDLWISIVVHKAFVDVKETGTEAAAATAVVQKTWGGVGVFIRDKIHVFRADHPFLFLIRDTRTGAILFFGRVLDPTK